ncbi:DUF2304 domain-containing protein [Microbacterium sp. 2FI]|uniref:DUF2304 domain-containing protein n=1 Tax=Microbacterium sp. 2FI TaxID=2502193 RepID=UPI0010F84043|nr:DUF2304 domain-containing protein [Microbacterium sp. 2FI]
MTYAFGVAAAVLALIAIVELMRRATLRERHAVWWLIGGVIALVVALFPQTLTWAAQLLGIAVPTNLVFFIAIGLLFLVSLQYGAELTRVEDKIRTLAEQSAFHELRLAELEAARPADGTTSGADETPAGGTADDGSDAPR